MKNKYLLVSPDYPPPLVGGSLVYVHSLVENCPESLDILTSQMPAGCQEVTSSRHRLIRSRFLVDSHNPSWRKLFRMYVYMVLWVFVHNLRGRYKTVIVNPGVVGNSLLILTLKVLRIPVIGIGYAEELSTVIHGDGWKRRIKRTLMKAGYRRADGFVVVCDFAKNILMALGLPPERICTLPPPYYVNKLGEGGRKEMGGHHVLSVGRLIPRKGFGYLIEAIGLLKDEIPDIRLTIVGGGDEREKLEEKIRVLGLSQSIEIRGQVPDEELRQLYATCDLFVLANLMLENGDCEGAPLVFTEAGSFGTPVIGGIEGGTSTMISDGENGFLVNPKNIQELAGKIRHVLLNPELGRALGEGGLQKSRRDHDPVKAGDFFHRMLQDFS